VVSVGRYDDRGRDRNRRGSGYPRHGRCAHSFATAVPTQDDDPKICTDNDSDDEPIDLIEN
jgi:hypothetical protein